MSLYPIYNAFIDATLIKILMIQFF